MCSSAKSDGFQVGNLRGRIEGLDCSLIETERGLSGTTENKARAQVRVGPAFVKGGLFPLQVHLK